MKVLLTLIYIISLICAFMVFILFAVPVLNVRSNPMPLFSIILSVFLLFFGIYGLIGEKLISGFRKQSPESIEIASAYYARKKGILGKLFLFPFIHVKSRSSLIIAFFGSLSWIIILMIIYFGLIVKL